MDEMLIRFFFQQIQPKNSVSYLRQQADELYFCLTKPLTLDSLLFCKTRMDSFLVPTQLLKILTLWQDSTDSILDKKIQKVLEDTYINIYNYYYYINKTQNFNHNLSSQYEYEWIKIRRICSSSFISHKNAKHHHIDSTQIR